MTIKTEKADLSAFRQPSEFNSLKYHKKILHYLTRAFDDNSLPHALLFTGLQGIGKEAAAQFFSMTCNCTDRIVPVQPGHEIGCQSGNEDNNPWPCGRCRSCRKILNNSHPDIFLIRPAGSTIKIDQIRGLIQKLSLKPYEAANRFVIIADADTMNSEAGNALLKVLEEPPDHTTIIMTAGQVSDLLPTIVSRCMHLRLRPLPEDYIAEVLREEHGASPDEAKSIAAMAFGSLTRAVAMNKGHWLDRRNRLIQELIHLRTQSTGFILAFAARISQDKDTLAECLDIFATWLRDLIVFPCAPGQIVYADLADSMQDQCQQSDPATLLSLIDMIYRSRRKIESNGNARLSTEVLAMKLAGR